jgi:hypothetical protein
MKKAKRNRQRKRAFAALVARKVLSDKTVSKKNTGDCGRFVVLVAYLLHEVYVAAVLFHLTTSSQALDTNLPSTSQKKHSWSVGWFFSTRG